MCEILEELKGFLLCKRAAVYLNLVGVVSMLIYYQLTEWCVYSLRNVYSAHSLVLTCYVLADLTVTGHSIFTNIRNTALCHRCSFDHRS